MKKTFITNLQYTDDTIIFGHADIKEAIIWKWILHTCEEWSNLTIKRVTSSSLVKLTWTIWLERVLGYARGIFSIKYLGVHWEKIDSRKKSGWESLKKHKKLEGWQDTFMSLGGWLVLINSMLSAALLYQTLIFKMPKLAMKKIDKIRREFFLGGNG